MIGQTAQFQAVGTFSKTSHPSTTRDITSEVQWSSNIVSVATIDNGGLVTAVDNGTTVITASMNGSLGVVTGTSNLNVSTSGGGVHDLLSLSIIPPPSPVQVLNNLGETAQFLAIGTFNSIPTTQDMTNQVTWVSSDIGVATISSAGLATAGIVAGETTITAIATAASGATITGTATLITNGGGGGQLPTLAVYAVGLGTGTVTSSPVGINCTSGAGCTGNFQLNATVTLTAVPTPGSTNTFGGWSSNCTPSNQPTCTITMSNNDAVGVIFNH